MSGKKKNRDQDKSLKTIVLITALIQLINSLVGLINKLLE